ncbi:MAG: alkaline phosphatase family protein [Vicinamibacteria bacterium]
MKRVALVVGLLLGAAAPAAFASRMWDWVLNFDPGFEFRHEPVPTGAPSSQSVTILLVDGLRLDASRAMPTLNALRGQGADIEAQVGTPSFSRPGRATVAVGAFPSIHGVTTNRQTRAIPLDNIIRRVGALGGTCRVAGSKIWWSLFGRDIERCGVYREGEGKEGPGAFVRQVGEVRASQEAGVAFVLEKASTLRVADIISTDFAAHEYGGTSAEYHAEVQRADTLLAGLVKGLDLSKETLVITADHGHRDAGGHGGEEANVLAIPIVMVGAGIRPGVVAKASQADIAPTVAALLGAALPTASAGGPIESALLLDESRRSLLAAAAAEQRAGFERAMGERLGMIVHPGERTDWASRILAHREAEKKRRLPFLIILAVLIPGLALAAVHFSRARGSALVVGAAALIACLLGPFGAAIPAMSFSSINYDEMLVPFFIRILTLAAIVTLIAALIAVGAGHAFRRRPVPDSPFDRAGSMGLMWSAALLVMTAGWWWEFDLLSPLTLPGPDRLVQAFSLTLATLSASVTTLALLVALWLIEAARRSRGAAQRIGAP